MSILFLSPHTDDVELGCGGVISKLAKSKKDVHVAIFSICEDSVPDGFDKKALRSESESSLRSLGIKKENIHYFNYKVREFNYKRQNILDDMINLRRLLSPEIVFTPSTFDVHQDHEVVSKESIRCFKNKSSIYGYQLPWNCEIIVNNFSIELSEENIKNKIKSLDFYKTQNFRAYFKNDFILSSSKFFGAINGFEHSESFQIIRQNKGFL
tara:strand:+ start:1600 stop:2232 length:633 start_codon:yes stop_codon:yes gene_type:complete